MSSKGEGALHAEVVAWLESKPFRVPVVWTHIPTGRGGKRDGATLKRLGAQAGMPDFILFFECEEEDNGYSTYSSPDYEAIRSEWGGVVLIELKSPKGYPSANQKAMFARLEEVKHPVYVCRSLGEVKHALQNQSTTLLKERHYDE